MGIVSLLNTEMVMIVLLWLNTQIAMIVKVLQDFARRASTLKNIFIKHLEHASQKGLMGR